MLLLLVYRHMIKSDNTNIYIYVIKSASRLTVELTQLSITKQLSQIESMVDHIYLQ